MGIVFNKIRTLLHERFSFHYDQIQPQTEFELELGTDSKEMLELIIEFEATFNIEIDLDEIITIKTIQDAVNYVEEKMIAQDKLYNNMT